MRDDLRVFDKTCFPMFFHDQGIVLRKHSVREKDEVVILLTKAHGKMSFTSYGSRDPKSRKAGPLELFNTIAFEARKGKAKLPVLQQIKPLKLRAFGLLEEEGTLDAFYRASEIIRLTHEYLQDLQNVPFVYDLLSEALDAVQQPSSSLVYWIQLLKGLGYLPDWHQCSHCSQELELKQQIVFSSAHRGFAHEGCCKEHRELSSDLLDEGLIKVMSYWQRERFGLGIRVDADQKISTKVLQFLSQLDLHD